MFAPKAGSKKDLKAQYPELLEYPEFKSDRLRSGDALFVWFMRCRMSPYYDMADEKKLEYCIRLSYETTSQQDTKLTEFANLKFPDSIKAAMGRMEKFNTSARVENYVYTRTIRDACKTILAKDVKSMKPAEVDIWLSQVKSAWKLLQETATAIEGHIGGTVEEEDAGISNTEGGVRHFRQNRK